MNDPAVKTALAICILLAGICAALLLRPDRPRPVPAELDDTNEILLRCRNAKKINANAVSTEQPNPSTLPKLSASSENSSPLQPNPPSVTIVTPSDRHESLPTLAPNYPESRQSSQFHERPVMEMMLPVVVPNDMAARSHEVVDGDTLATLATRYFGDAAHAQEIYDANRDVLANPNLLPIGVKLKLPPRTNALKADSSASMSESPMQGHLVPVQ
jgi:phage tail protein X